MDVNCPGQRATVLVAFAWIGKTLTPSRAGKERKEPPPAMAFRAPARKEARISHACCSFFLSVDLQDQALQIFSLRNIKYDRMIRSRAPAFQQANPALRISGRIGHHAMKLIPRNMVGAGAGHQYPTRAQHLQ